MQVAGTGTATKGGAADSGVVQPMPPKTTNIQFQFQATFQQEEEADETMANLLGPEDVYTRGSAK